MDFLEKYPNSDYIVTQLSATNLRVTCPDHGAFEISPTNFTYMRGCFLCRGIHPRAYPVGSTRANQGHPVYVNALADGSVQVSKVSTASVYAIGYSDKRIASAVISIASELVARGDYATAKDFMYKAAFFKVAPGVGVKGALLREFLSDSIPESSDPYAAQYPGSGYVIDELDATNLRVTCPDHGDFEISRDNFLYHRGCTLCRGLNPRAYPIQSRRKAEGNIVYLNNDGTASDIHNNPFYAVSFRDKRVASAAIKIVNGFSAPFDVSLAKHALVAMATSNIVPPRKAVEKKNTAKNCVFIRIADDGAFTAYPPDTIYTSAHCLAFYSTRLEAELVYHILTKLKPEQTLEAMTILNAANAWSVKGAQK